MEPGGLFKEFEEVFPCFSEGAMVGGGGVEEEIFEGHDSSGTIGDCWQEIRFGQILVVLGEDADSFDSGSTRGEVYIFVYVTKHPRVPLLVVPSFPADIIQYTICFPVHSREEMLALCFLHPSKPDQVDLDLTDWVLLSSGDAGWQVYRESKESNQFVFVLEDGAAFWMDYPTPPAPRDTVDGLCRSVGEWFSLARDGKRPRSGARDGHMHQILRIAAEMYTGTHHPLVLEGLVRWLGQYDRAPEEPGSLPLQVRRDLVSMIAPAAWTGSETRFAVIEQDGFSSPFFQVCYLGSEQHVTKTEYVFEREFPEEMPRFMAAVSGEDRGSFRVWLEGRFSSGVAEAAVFEASLLV